MSKAQQVIEQYLSSVTEGKAWQVDIKGAPGGGRLTTWTNPEFDLGIVKSPQTAGSFIIMHKSTGEMTKTRMGSLPQAKKYIVKNSEKK